MAPVVAELADEFEGRVKIAKMDVDANQKTPAKYGVRSIPTMIMAMTRPKEQHQTPAKDRPFRNSRMTVDEDMDTLIGSRPSQKTDASEAVQFAAYGCPSCGFIAAFNAVTLGAKSEI